MVARLRPANGIAAPIVTLLVLLFATFAAPTASIGHSRRRRHQPTKDKIMGCGLGYRGQHLPTEGRVAVLLRGQPFRDGRRGGNTCVRSSTKAQRGATRSLMSKVVHPLLRRQNKVDLFSTSQQCSLMQEVEKILTVPGTTLKETTLAHLRNQGDNMKAAVDFLVHSVGSMEQVMTTYDLVIITRHDIEWYQRISRWPVADFCRFNFGSLCEPGANLRPSCVNDIIHTVPGHLFNVTSALVNCFVDTKWGHTCRERMEDAAGKEHVGFLTDWVPEQSVRERVKNPWARPYGITS